MTDPGRRALPRTSPAAGTARHETRWPGSGIASCPRRPREIMQPLGRLAPPAACFGCQFPRGAPHRSAPCSSFFFDGATDHPAGTAVRRSSARSGLDVVRTAALRSGSCRLPAVSAAIAAADAQMSAAGPRGRTSRSRLPCSVRRCRRQLRAVACTSSVSRQLLDRVAGGVKLIHQPVRQQIGRCQG